MCDTVAVHTCTYGIRNTRGPCVSGTKVPIYSAVILSSIACIGVIAQEGVQKDQTQTTHFDVRTGVGVIARVRVTAQV